MTRRNGYSKLIMMMMVNYIQGKKGLGDKPGIGVWWFYTFL